MVRLLVSLMILLVFQQPRVLAGSSKSPLLELYIPGHVRLVDHSSFKLKTKGMDKFGTLLYTETCQVRITVFDLSGKAIFMYPNSKTLCDQRLIGVSAKRGVWTELTLPLDSLTRANLQSGKYMINVHMRAFAKQESKNSSPFTFTSNMATLEVR